MAQPPRREPDYVLRLMTDAAKANRHDPLRRGHLLHLPETGDVMVTGDLHGHLPNFQRIVRVADLPNHPHRHLILQELLHAMYDDTPDRSHQLLEEAAVLKNVYPRQVHFLLANHDLAELLGLDVMKRGRSVLRAFDEALDEAYSFNKDVVRQAYERFLRSLPWAARTAHGLLLSHSIPDERHLHLFTPEVFHQSPDAPPLDKHSPVFRMVWGRDLSGHTARQFLQRLDASLALIGHHPCRDGHAQPNPHTVVIDSKDGHGAYVLLPLDRALTQDEIVQRIRHLNY